MPMILAVLLVAIISLTAFARAIQPVPAQDAHESSPVLALQPRPDPAVVLLATRSDPILI
jgi:hypothetical protein